LGLRELVGLEEPCVEHRLADGSNSLRVGEADIELREELILGLADGLEDRHFRGSLHVDLLIDRELGSGL